LAKLALICEQSIASVAFTTQPHCNGSPQNLNQRFPTISLGLEPIHSLSLRACIGTMLPTAF